jgi:CheY-like chemotaxis protein
LRGGSETILCVEDDDVVRAHVIGPLESLGYKVIAASNAAQALELVNSGTAFDLLFTDIVMPGAMNGRQLAQKVAELRRPLGCSTHSGNTFGAFDSSGRPRRGRAAADQAVPQGRASPAWCASASTARSTTWAIRYRCLIPCRRTSSVS